MIQELTAQAKTIFFGIMIGDLFGDVDPDTENIDVDASINEYAAMCKKAIVEGFAKHGGAVTVDWDSQNIGGAIPYKLKTKVNGENEHDDVAFVDNIIDDVWSDWNWIVYN